MKNITLLVAAIAITSLSVNARQLTPEQAAERARQAMPAAATLAIGETNNLRHTVTITTNDQPSVYVFNSSTTGYIATPADDCAPAVLGYGSGQVPSDLNLIPPAMRYWLDEYGKQVAYMRQHGLTIGEAATNTSMSAIAPLTTTLWNQDSPYNNLCPTVNGERSVTGCVATALAQVMKYHNWPTKGTSSKSYTLNSQTISFDYANTTFEWDKMLNEYTSTSTAAEKTAVATLMFACGVSVDMQYTPQESSASSIVVPVALVDYFNYDKGVRYIPRDYYGIEEWQEIVYNNLVNYGPMQYSGQSDDGGHSFVCDGYDGNGYFHINWGWGGMSDGYFLLTALTPDSQGIGGSTSGYNYMQDIIACVQPPKSDSKIYEQIYAEDNFLPESDQVQLGNSAVFTGGFYSYSAGQISGTLGVKLVASDGSVQYLSGTEFKDMDLGYGYTQYSVVLPQTLANGTYTVTPAFKTSSGEWRDIPVKLSCMQSLKMTVDNLTATFAAGKEATLTITDLTPATDFYVDNSFEVTANIENTGDGEYYGAVALALIDENGNMVAVGANYPLDLQQGEKKEISYVSTFTATSSTSALSAGNYYICFIDPTTYAQLSDAVEVTVKSKPATTTITSEAPVVANANQVIADEFSATVKVTCTEGYFGGPLTLVIFPYEPGQNVSSVATFTTDPVFLEAGSSTTVTVSSPFTAGVPGKQYFCALYNGQSPISSSYGYFTVTKTTGVEEVDADDVVETHYYNMQGTPVKGQPIPGLYIRVNIHSNGSVTKAKTLVR